MLLYLHGFRSAPASNKARQLAARMAELGLEAHFRCPQLPPSPAAAIALAEDILATARGPATVVGSSLGGYYATWLAERHTLRAVLVNPAVVAHLSLAAFVGTQTNLYTGEAFEFTRGHVAELAALEVPTLSRPRDFWLMVETGDEVLDHRDAVAKYAGARQTVIEGGDHSFQHWPRLLDEVLRFSDLIVP